MNWSSQDLVRFVEWLDQAELWLFIVTAAVVAVLVGEIARHHHGQQSAGWLHVITAVAGITYYCHHSRVYDPCGEGQVVIGLRGVLFGFIVRGMTALVFFVFLTSWQTTKELVRRAIAQPMERRRDAARLAEESVVIVEEEELEPPEPTEAERDEMFEEAMRKVRLRFVRRCKVIRDHLELDEYERQAAVTKARAKMTSEMNEVMEKLG